MPISTATMALARSRSIVAAMAVGLLVAACAGQASPPPPTPTPTPKAYVQPTPWPHFKDAASADDLFRALLADGLLITPNSATTGAKGKEPVKRINATYHGQPLTIAQYSSAKAAGAQNTWKAGTKPGKGEPPVTFVGLNLVVQWGPTSGAVPKTLVGEQLSAARSLEASLARLLAPLRTRAIVDVSASSPSPSPTGSASGSTSPVPTVARSAPPSPTASPTK